MRCSASETLMSDSSDPDSHGTSDYPPTSIP